MDGNSMNLEMNLRSTLTFFNKMLLIVYATGDVYLYDGKKGYLVMEVKL
jgi:hypothetical protein